MNDRRDPQAHDRTTSRFDQVDVFASTAWSGNPLAVVHDADHWSTDDMVAFTRWTNLSEATFLLAPTDPAADYRVRIFFPAGELPFAGHPTLGSCAAWLAAGGAPGDDRIVVQECGAGLVRVRREGDRLAFAAPPMIRDEPVADDELADVVALLGLDAADVVAARWIDNGPGWLGVVLRDATAVLDVPVPATRRPGFDVGLVGLHPPGGECALEVRAFFADADGAIREDPVTGSLNASAAQWLLREGVLTAPFVAAQGTAMGRRGRIHVDRDAHDVWIGGHTHLRIAGTIHP